MQRSKLYGAAEGTRADVESKESDVAEIQAALTEAAAGDFASDKDVAARAPKRRVKAR